MDDNFNNIEELLKGTLDGYGKQPSPKVWKAISLRLFFRSSLFYASAIIFLIGIGVGGYWLFNGSNTVITEGKTVINTAVESDGFVSNRTEEVLKAEQTIEQTHLDNTTKNLKNSDIRNTNVSNELENDNNKQIKNLSSASANADNQKKPNGKDLVTGDVVAHDINSSPYTVNNKNNYPGLPTLNDNSISFMPSVYGMAVNSFKNSYPGSINMNSAYSNFELVPKSDYGKINGSFSTGLFIMPELIFANDTNNSKKRAVNVDLTGMYGDDFFLEAGLGVSISDDDGKFDINYSQYDSIGYFYQVNSFEIDPVTGEPVFKTTLEGLYDTVDYRTSATSNNRYTYLRIPVYVGYTIRRFKRLSLYLKAGGIYSILVSSYEPGVDYVNDNATSIVINDETPQRINSYFKLSASLGISYSLSNRVNLTLEPVYNYYMQPIYERRATNKSPWSVGLRFGVLIKLK